VRAALLVAATLLGASLPAEDAVQPMGGPVLEPSTPECLGVYWTVRGDDNRSARIELDWRPAGDPAWHAGAPLLRVEKGTHRQAGKETHPSLIEVPADGWLFAGSVLFLRPDTAYELRLRLGDPDGGAAEQLLATRTAREPALAADAPRRHVMPGDGGGSGSASDPFHGLAAAQAAARPGDVFLVHAGTYPAFAISASGEPGRPIAWLGAGDGEAVIDGGGGERGISAADLHDLWFEGLAIRNAGFGLVGNGSTRFVVRRCRLSDVGYGITCGRNERGRVQGWFVTDNVLTGRMKWLVLDTPEGMAQWHQETRGIELTGSGHVIAHNRVSHFKDAIDTAPSSACNAIDICDNELGQLIDDGIEMDGSERNTRCFRNRITDCHTGISTQPIFGGPVYILRNVIANPQSEPFKLHNRPSGGVILHNTVLKRGPLLFVSTSDPLSNFTFRNNLFIGSEGRAVDIEPPATVCDLDHDGFGGFSGEVFMKWNGVRYATLDEVRAKAPIERHAVAVDPATTFASGARTPEDPRHEHRPYDLRLKPGSVAIDGGVDLPGITAGFAGRAPDLGAYEVGADLPGYGPR
jgi:hypothetical protein